MELLQLRYFCALAERQHLSNTAAELRIAPPSLSLTISKLEGELGLPLFDRVKRQIRLNENGRLFYAKAKAALELLDESVQELDTLRRMKENTIRVALTSPMIWTDFFTQFQAIYPEINLETKVVFLDTLSGDFTFDFFLGNKWDIPDNGWEVRQVRKPEQNLLMVSKSHPLASRKSVMVEELREETFITLGENNPTTDFYVRKLCEAHGFHPKKVITANYFTRISHLKQNDGVVLTSDLGLAKHFVVDKTVCKVRIKNARLRRCQAIAWKRNAVHSRAAQVFLSAVLEYYAGA